MNTPRNVRAVTIIPPRMESFIPMDMGRMTKKRVAAYARVSTEFEEQQSSFDAQLDYYTKYIQAKEEWDFVEVYTDDGISATSTKKREGFNRMITDALGGKIDLIVTKSVSRFARNTVDTLITVRQLKEAGVEVFFEKENIYTMGSKGELLITIMSSLAQEESRSISENVTWGKRKSFADGKISLPYKKFLGYEKGEDGLPQIIEDQAKTVRLIYKLFLEGKTPAAIGRYLMNEKIPTPGGKMKWSVSTILSILKNEKYKGDAVLQKTYTVDFLTKKKKSNEGEVPQYYVENSHPAIIYPAVYDLVQHELKKRKQEKGYKTSASPFSGKIVCGECGSFYGSKVWHSTSKYRRVIWQCNHKFDKAEKCQTSHLYEDDLKRAFVEGFNKHMENKEEIIRNYEAAVKVIFNTKDLEKELLKHQNDYQLIVKEIQMLVDENASTAQDQSEYQKQYNFLVEKYEHTKNRMIEIEDEMKDKTARRLEMKEFINRLRNTEELLTQFDEKLFLATIEKIIIQADSKMIIVFKDGAKIELIKTYSSY